MNYKDNDQDLLYIETDLFTLALKGKPVHPDIKQLYPERNKEQAYKASLKLDPVACNIEKFSCFSPSNGLVESDSLNPEVYPFFYEQQNYLLFIEGKEDIDLEFFHENSKVRESVSRYPGKNNQLMGIINFRNDVGYSELEIKGNEQTLLIITIEVFPSKIDYQSDYYSLLQEVNDEIYNLSYDFLRRTFQGTGLKETSDTTLTEFYSIIRIIFNNFIKAYYRIENYPHHRLNQSSSVLPAARVRKINQQSIKWLRKNKQYYNKELGLPTRMLNIDKQISFDTFENRFVKWIILRLLKKLNLFEKRYMGIYEDRVETFVIKMLNKMKKKLEFILKNSFLQEVGELYKIDSLSLVMQMAPGYREIYKYYLMLQKGLSINGEIFKLSMKQIWELYEYWCFLELNKIMREKYNLIKNDLIDIDYSGIYVKLSRGSSSSIEYENPVTGEKFNLTYNIGQGEKITTNQKPDNVLTLKKEGSAVEYKFIFDAKYRINPAYPDTRYHSIYNGIPGPEEDTINTMHRYRDAIVKNHENSTDRVVVGAFVLFPYHDEEKFKDHRFYKSIDDVNVGAFPFLPDSTDLLSDFLKDIIEESYLGNYERNILPAGTDDYRRDTDFEQNVLVGSIRNKGQLEYMLQEKIYYIPCKRMRLDKYQLEYIAVYLKKTDFPENYGVSYYGQISKIEVKKRKNINIPMNRNNGEESYYVFHLKDWQQLESNILPEGYGVLGSHIYTNFMLLQKAATLPELSIRTMEEWRVWLELKRVQGEIKLLLDKNSITQNTSLQGFEINDIKVEVNSDGIVVTNNRDSKRYRHKQLAYNLRGVMKEIFGR
ncbi:MAG: DUF2357 domain-containing protein [bacterium]